MPELEAPECVRYTLHGLYLGKPVATVLDMYVNNALLVDYSGELFTLAGDILNNWAQHVVPGLSNQYQFTSISWLDLGDGGWTGERTGTDSYDLPVAGGEAGQPISGNTAMLVLKATEARRGERQGRMFLPGAVEPYIEGNFLTPAFVASFNSDNLVPFYDGINDNGTGPGEAAHWPVVIHTKNGVYQSRSRVNAFTLQGQVASQRRRNRR